MSGPVICAPLRVEARALRRGLRDVAAQSPDGNGQANGQGGNGHGQIGVLRTGYGPARSASAATRPELAGAGVVAVGGVAGALADDLKVGDLVVGSLVSGAGTAVSCPSAPLLAGELRRAGLDARVGPIAIVGRLARKDNHAALAATGAIAVDMESAPLLSAADGRPAIVVRAISDLPGHSLVSPRTVTGGIAALRSLRQAGPLRRTTVVFLLARSHAASTTRHVSSP